MVEESQQELCSWLYGGGGQTEMRRQKREEQKAYSSERVGQRKEGAGDKGYVFSGSSKGFVSPERERVICLSSEKG